MCIYALVPTEGEDGVEGLDDRVVEAERLVVEGLCGEWMR